MRLLIAACLLSAFGAASAAPELRDDPYGNNKSLYEVLRNNPQFRALPLAKPTLCRVDTSEGEGLAVYEHTPLGRGVVGTEVADYTKFDEDKLVGETYKQSGAFGGMILLRGTSAPSRDFTYRGDDMFPLVEGKNFTITLQRSQSQLEYACTVRKAPGSMKLKGLDPLHLVSCQRRTLLGNGDSRLETSNHALCSNQAGLCPLHWTGDEGHKALFEHYTVNNEKFSPVSWTCETAR
jgi:hypothetical protein